MLEADRWIVHLDEHFALWSTQPMMGRTRHELLPELRSLAIGRYVVFFIPLLDGIDVVRVLHAARDLDELFG